MKYYTSYYLQAKAENKASKESSVTRSDGQMNIEQPLEADWNFIGVSSPLVKIDPAVFRDSYYEIIGTSCSEYIYLKGATSTIDLKHGSSYWIFTSKASYTVLVIIHYN